MNSTTTLEEQYELLAFGQNAAKVMSEKPHVASYSYDGQIAPGKFVALRWGLQDDCVLVFKVDENFTPVNFQGAIKTS